MIDLSHLTEEEQGMILTVLRRDAELKKAEEERVRKLTGTSESEDKMKYMSGEWFYEAKSRRHMDKIHGSEIILASMKQRKDNSLKTEKPRVPSGPGPDLVAPPKPARCLEARQLQVTNDAEKENLNSAIHSPRTPRHNPFNSTSLIEPSENNIDSLPRRESAETDLTLKSRPADEVSLTSGGSIISESSSAGFKPVPKKRTFLSRRSSETNGPGTGAQAAPAGIVPAPRRRTQRGSSGSSNQSHLKNQNEKDASPVFEPASLPPCVAAEETPQQQQLRDGSHQSRKSSAERERGSPSIKRERSATFVIDDAAAERDSRLRSEDRGDQSRREHAGVNPVALLMGSALFSDRGTSSSSAGRLRQEELSLPQSTVDAEPPVSYDLNFIEKSDPQTQMSPSQTHGFKLSTQPTSPNSDEDSIAKVLDWFSRSMDSNDLLDTDDDPATTKSSDRSRSEEYTRKDSKELRVMDRAGKKEASEAQEVKHKEDESQPLKISHLRSFWEKSNMGPKILIRNSITPSDEGQQHDYLPAEKEEEPNMEADAPTSSRLYNGRGIYEYNSRREPKDGLDNVHLNNNLQDSLSSRNNHDSSYNSDYFKFNPQATDFLTRLGPQPKTESRLQSPEPEGISSGKSYPQLESVFQSREVFSQEDEPNYQNGGNVQAHRGSSDDSMRRDGEDKRVQSSMSPKRKEDEKRTNRQGVAAQESTAERIKQLKTFWEQERNKPFFYSGLPKSHGEGKPGRGANQLNKRFTKSEFDLRSIGHNSGSDDEESKPYQNSTVLPMNQRIEKSSPSLSASRSQFNTLRDFWDEAVSDTKGSFSSDKSKSPKRKDPANAQFTFQELKSGDLAENYNLSTPAEKPRPSPMKTMPSSSPQNRSKSPQDRQMGSGVRASMENKNILSGYATVDSRRSSKDSGREEKPSKPQCGSGKEPRSPKHRKDNWGSKSGSRGGSLRRTTSMFSLSVPEEKDPGQRKMEASPVHSQSRKQRQNAEKAARGRRSSEGTDVMTTRARAFVPRDYRHYLGMTDKTSVHTSLAPTVEHDAAQVKSGYNFDLSGPVRASTPVSSEERYGRKGSKSSQRPLWANYSTSDTGQESSMSSTSDTWSTSRNSSNRDNEDESQNPVRKALRRAEAWPKNVAKSIEDMTTCLSPRQDSITDLRRVSDASTLPSPSSLYSDPDHLKKMSKSVPSFLQNEDTDTDYVDGYSQRGTLPLGHSMTDFSPPSGRKSMSSLSGSVMTMYNADFGSVEVQGNIQFSINYVQRLREFHIFIAECHDLAAVDPKRGRSDPYVKSYLVPDKANLGKRKTSVKKKSLNPAFNEILRYRVRMEYLRTQTLILSVWHHDTFGKNSFLGEVDMDLSKWDFDHTQMNYLVLKARTTPSVVPVNGRGEMRLAIRFLPQITHSEGVTKDGAITGEVHIWVKECKNLPLIRATIDPYVKCFILPDTSRKSRQKTRVLRRTVDPVFNHTMVYDGISEADLTDACVELTVWDRDRLASNLLGGLRLGVGSGKSYGAEVDWMDSSPYEVALWERMIASPDEWVEDVLPLRVVNGAKSAHK